MPISKLVTYITPSMVNSSTDGFRNELDAYWVTQDRSTKRSSKPQLYYLAKHKSSVKNTNIVDFALGVETSNDNARLPTKTVSMRVYGNASIFENQTHWAAFVNGGHYNGTSYNGILTTGTDYEDHTFTCEQPFTTREAKDLGGNSRVKISDVNLEYNFYQPEYEQMLGRGFNEKLLPNIYSIYSLKENDALTSRNKLFKLHVSLGGSLSENETNKFTDKASENPGASNSLEYLKTFSKRLMAGSLGPQTSGLIRNAYANVMMSPASTPILSYNNKKHMFPMYGEITFATDKTTQFTQILQDAEVSAIFMKDLYGSTLNRTGWHAVQKNFATHMVIPVEASNELGTTTIINKVIAGNASARVWNVEDWYNEFKTSMPNNMSTGIFVGLENREIEMAESRDHGFYKKMMETIFIGKVRTLVKSQQRRFADIIDGDSCYSEELIYRIDKYVGQPTGEPVQTYWLANTNDVDVYNFIDTQVKYGEQYSYKATAYNLVIGARYRYSKLAVTKRVTQDCVEFVSNNEPVPPRVPGHVTVNNITGTRTAISVPSDQRFMAEVDITVSPHIFIVETPFFVHTSRLIDDPPLPPEIDILPYRTDSRFLKFFMQGNSGERDIDPVIITDDDEAMIDTIR